MENKIMEVLKGMEDGDLISVWNEYCDKCNMFDDRIYYMEELDEIFSGQDVSYILNRAFYGHDQWGITQNSIQIETILLLMYTVT